MSDSQYAGKLFLSQAINATDPAANKNVGDGNDDNLDIEDVIAKELSEMKRPHSSNNFASIQTGTDCATSSSSPPSPPATNPTTSVTSTTTLPHNSPDFTSSIRDTTTVTVSTIATSTIISTTIITTTITKTTTKTFNNLVDENVCYPLDL
ncbi:17242_t:CDS:2 [Entrophospora sp. SA101]|nr:17242_t:CDS:2 [Entrophospora sp. SA101]